MNKKERMYQQIEEHGANLNKLFNTELGNIELCKKLRKLENKADHLSLEYCNGNIELDYFEVEKDKMMLKVDKILHFKEKNIPVFFNSDPRGYALKIDDSYEHNIYRDMGGYGILAPDFRE